MKTRQVSALIGTSTATLRAAIERGKVPAPAKDISGDFVWTEDDVETARRAMSVDRRRRENRQPQPAA